MKLNTFHFIIEYLIAFLYSEFQLNMNLIFFMKIILNKILILMGLILLFSPYLCAQSPNIILIIADDLGVDAFNGYNLGAVNPSTPHLDSLRLNGLTFTNAWSSPVCTPTRAGIMSGKYGSKNGVKTAPGNLDTAHVSVMNALKLVDSFYSSAVTGKWHISKPINPLHPGWHGADHYTGILGAGWAAYDNWQKTENGITDTCFDYATTYFTDDALNWIGNQNQPFFLWLAHIAPHTPYHVPPAYMHSQPSTNSQIKKYMAMIESLDYEVGRMIDSLSPAVLANTTFIFIGDNGSPNNVLQDYPAGRGKESLYQGGVHVPMFVAGASVSRSGETEDALVNVIDIYATVLELAGADLPGGMYNSLSFKHLLSSSVPPKRQYNFSEIDTNASTINTMGFTIRDSQYKLIEHLGGTQEMYDLLNDSLELNDLLSGTLTAIQQAAKTDLENEAIQRRTAWSCKDDIKNGDETGIDCGGTFCAPCITSVDGMELKDRVLSVYPNPCETVLNVSVNEGSVSKVEMFNILGELVYIDENINSSFIKINTSDIMSQVCFLFVYQKDEIKCVKIVIQ